MKRFLKRLALVLLPLVLILGWWTWRLVWGRPLNLNHFYERVFIELLLDDPELLSQLGFIDNTILDFHSDKLTDASPARELRLLEKTRRDLATLRSYPRDRQTPAQRLSTEVLEWYLDLAVQGERFLHHDYPVNQLHGAQNALPSFMDSVHQVRNASSARNYLARLRAFGPKFDQVIEGLRLRESKGILPPRFVLEKVLREIRDFTARPAADNLLRTSFRKKLDAANQLSAAEKDAFAAQATAVIQDSVYPAYRKLAGCLEEQLTRATTDDGVWKLPDGDAFYAFTLRAMTSTDYTPAQVHALGLSEVARIQGEMRQILDGLGLTGRSVSEHLGELSRDPRFLYPNTDEGRAQMLAEYQRILDEIDRGLTNAFGLRPKQGVKVERVPEFKEKTTPPAYYEAPAMDGSRPGRFFANLRDPRELARFGMRTMAYHEGIPGHHFQVALAQEMRGVPTFRRVIPFTAFAEGWALYAEQLAWELGFQNDPYNNLGRLQAELWRAARLVVDTGIHFKRWTRDQAIDYMIGNAGLNREVATTEVERYIVNPGQACAYKIGMIRLLELRERSRKALGPRFDLREFHRALLQNGAVPLTVLERLVDDSIAARMPPLAPAAR